MRPRQSTTGIVLAVMTTGLLAACGSENGDTSTGAVASPTETETASPEPDTSNESSSAPASTESVTTEPPTTDVPATEPPATDAAASTEAPDEMAEDPPRPPAPPLEEPTTLLVDGVEPLGEIPLPTQPPSEPGSYHSYRLGTEIVLTVPVSFTLGQHRAGSIGWDLDSERIFVLARWSQNESVTPDKWIASLLASSWDVTETAVEPINGHAARRFDIELTPNGDPPLSVDADGALSFGDGLPRRVWIIDQDDQQPLVVGTGISSDDWSDVVDGVVGSLEIGPTLPDPRIGRNPIEYGGFFGRLTADDQYRTLLFGDTVFSMPVDFSGLAASQFLTLDVPGDYTGTSRPGVDVGAVGALIIPPDDPSAGIFASTIGERPQTAAAFVAYLESLADRGLISGIRQLDDTITLLGESSTAIEFDVPGGDEVGGFLSQPDGWGGPIISTFKPATTYRFWAMDLDDQVAVVVARADTANADDLEAAADFAQTVAGAFEPT